MVAAVVGFVPCEHKHRVKEASWQRFVQNLTLTRAICSASVLHLMLVGRGSPLHAAWRLRPTARTECRALPVLHRPRGICAGSQRRKSPEKGQRDECRRASAISSARRAPSSSARSSSYKEKRCFGSGAIIRCKTRAVGTDTSGAIARSSAGCCFNARNSVAEFVLLAIGGVPATA